MKKLGITGNYCSGLEKASEVCGIMGIPLFEADLAIKFMLNWREDILRQSRIQFGQTIMLNGTVNPNAFNSAEKFDRLLDLIEVDLMLLWESFCKKHGGQEIVAFKSHIIFERSWKSRFDFVVNVYRPQRMRAHDISKMKHITHSQAMVLSSQEMDEMEKSTGSNYVIHNYDSLSFLTQFEVMRSIMDNKTTSYLPAPI